jgi:hypothetical protein
MKKQKTHALIIVLLITMIQLGNYAFAQNVFPTGVGTFVGIGTTTPAVNLVVKGDVKFIDPATTEEISFARPGGQNGFNLTSSAYPSSAHFKFDGLSLRILTTPVPGVPLNTAGIAIDKTYGWVGLGTTTPQCRFQLNDIISTNYGSFFNTNTNGPTLFVDRNPNGGLNPSLFLAGGYGSVFLNSLYTGNLGGDMISGYFKNIDPGQNVSIGVKSISTSTSQSFSSIAFDAKAENSQNAQGLNAWAVGAINTHGAFAIGEGGFTSNYGVYGKGIGYDCTSDVYGVHGQAYGGVNNYGIYGTILDATGGDPPPCATSFGLVIL